MLDEKQIEFLDKIVNTDYIYKDNFPEPFNVELYSTKLVNKRKIKIIRGEESDELYVYDKQTYLFCSLTFKTKAEAQTFISTKKMEISK